MSSFSVPLPLDSDGFLRRECPHCVQQFKWHHGPTADRPDGEIDPVGAPHAALPVTSVTAWDLRMSFLPLWGLLQDRPAGDPALPSATAHGGGARPRGAPRGPAGKIYCFCGGQNTRKRTGSGRKRSTCPRGSRDAQALAPPGQTGRSLSVTATSARQTRNRPSRGANHIQ